MKIKFLLLLNSETKPMDAHIKKRDVYWGGGGGIFYIQYKMECHPIYQVHLLYEAWLQNNDRTTSI
jgi:hypothetical protein